MYCQKLFASVILSLIIICSFQVDTASVDFKSSKIQGEVMDIHWCKDGFMVLLTDQNHLYRSTDNGRNWSALRDRLLSLGKSQIEYDNENVGEVKSIVVSPIDPNLMIFHGTHEINWRSEHCGDNIQAMNNGRPVDEFLFHPTQRQWILAAAWSKCEDYENDEECEVQYYNQIQKEVYVSEDLGDSWRMLEQFIVQFGWAKVSGHAHIPDKRVVIAHESFGRGHQQLNGWSEKIHTYYSDDYFKTKHLIVPQGNVFLLNKFYFFVVRVIHEQTQDVELLISDPAITPYQFKVVESPIRKLREHSYTIMDTSEGQIFIHINHYSSLAKFGNIYISDKSGGKFIHSLSNNVRNNAGQCDFEKLLSVEGVYISNIYDEQKVHSTKGAQGSIVSNVIQSSSEKQHAERNYELLHNYIQTKITFNKGITWHNLQPPALDKQGKPWSCTKDCFLHLNSQNSGQFGPVYSTDSAVGLIIGTGNGFFIMIVGTHLSTRQDEQHTFLSRDAGQTWQHIAVGSHIYDMGDHGGILVMADDQSVTNKVLYSWDEGLSWETLVLSDYFYIQNILTEPSNTGYHFLVYGRDEYNESYLIALDFSTLHQNICQNNDDYEHFTLPHCILGKSYTYLRRKQDSKCFNKNQDKLINTKPCSCTQEDYICSKNYERNNQNVCELKIVSKVSSECINNKITINQGYELIEGNQCQGGLDLKQIEVGCQDNGLLSKWLLFAVLTLVFGWFLNEKLGCVQFIKNWFSEGGLDPRQKGYKQHKGDIDIDQMVFENNEDEAEALYEDKLI